MAIQTTNAAYNQIQQNAPNIAALHSKLGLVKKERHFLASASIFIQLKNPVSFFLEEHFITRLDEIKTELEQNNGEDKNSLELSNQMCSLLYGSKEYLGEQSQIKPQYQNTHTLISQCIDHIFSLYLHYTDLSKKQIRKHYNKPIPGFID